MKLDKNLVIALVTFMLLTTAVFAAELSFTDVPKNAWYYGDVQNAVASGLVNGKTATTYAPDDNLTYAEAIKLASCMYMRAMTGSTEFEPSTPWYQTYVDYAKVNKIINHDYVWNAQASRAGYMGIFANAIPDQPALGTMTGLKAINNIPDGSIPDVYAGLEQADAIYKLYRAGILQGSDEKHSCKPADNIKRSEVAAILTRMIDASKRISFSMGVEEVVPDGEKLAISKSPASKKIGAFEEATFSVTATGGVKPYSYQWYCTNSTNKDGVAVKDSSSIDGAKTKTLTISNCKVADSGKFYWAVVTDANGNFVSSGTAKLTVEEVQKLTITGQPSSFEPMRGVTGTLTVSVSGGVKPYSYQWYKEDGTKVVDEELGDTKKVGFITGSTTNKLELLNTQGTLTNGTYYCVVTDSAGSKVTSNSADAKALAKLTISKQPVDTKIVDDGARFTITASGGTAPYSYQWYCTTNDNVKTLNDGAYYNGAKKNTLILKHANTLYGNESRQYKCEVTDSTGAKVMSNIAILNQDLTITKQPVDVDMKDTVQFTVAVSGGVAPYSYQWLTELGGGTLIEEKNYFYSGTKTNTLTIIDATCFPNRAYYCVITDSVGTEVVSKSGINKAGELTITTQPVDATSVNNTAKFTVAITGGKTPYNYKWYSRGDLLGSVDEIYAMSDTLTLEAVDAYLSAGYDKYYCEITDDEGTKIVSNTVTIK